MSIHNIRFSDCYVFKYTCHYASYVNGRLIHRGLNLLFRCVLKLPCALCYHQKSPPSDTISNRRPPHPAHHPPTSLPMPPPPPPPSVSSVWPQRHRGRAESTLHYRRARTFVALRAAVCIPDIRSATEFADRPHRPLSWRPTFDWHRHTAGADSVDRCHLRPVQQRPPCVWPLRPALRTHRRSCCRRTCCCYWCYYWRCCTFRVGGGYPPKLRLAQSRVAPPIAQVPLSLYTQKKGVVFCSGCGVESGCEMCSNLVYYVCCIFMLILYCIAYIHAQLTLLYMHSLCVGLLCVCAACIPQHYVRDAQLCYCFLCQLIVTVSDDFGSIDAAILEIGLTICTYVHREHEFQCALPTIDTHILHTQMSDDKYIRSHTYGVPVPRSSTRCLRLPPAPARHSHSQAARTN